MYQIIIIISLLIAGLLFPANAQTSDPVSNLKEALATYEKEEHSSQNLIKAAEKFEELANSDSQNWLPLYYAIYTRTLNAFTLEIGEAVDESDRLLEMYKQMEALNPDESEALTLRAFINTIKMVKDPVQYAMTLMDKIIWDYRTALSLNPENPRAMYLLAQFQMKSKEFMGGNPKDHCPTAQKAVELFKKEDKGSVKPHWGEEQAMGVLNEFCN